MTDRPLVSIVTPTLNQGRFIEQTIHSLKGQTYPAFEHIVIDGGSTDETLPILRRHEGSYPMRWLSEPDGGMYDAVNKGMRLATGEILAYLNSDDLYFPWTLEVVVGHFLRHPEADFVHGDVLNVDDETTIQILQFEPPFQRAYVVTSGGLAQPAVFWRRRAYELAGGLDADLRYVGDLDFWIRSARTSRFSKANEFLAVERNHRGTLREDGRERMQAEIVMVRRRHARPAAVQRQWDRLRGGVWRRLWFRANWLAFLIQTVIPPSLRAPCWRRLIESGHVAVSRWRVASMLLLPVAGRRLRSSLVKPSRYWLEPPPP